MTDKQIPTELTREHAAKDRTQNYPYSAHTYALSALSSLQNFLGKPAFREIDDMSLVMAYHMLEETVETLDKHRKQWTHPNNLV